MKASPLAFCFTAAALACVLFVAPPARAATAALQDTIIKSRGPLKMTNNGVEAYFVFTDEVRLTGTNLEITCDKLEIFIEQEAAAKKADGKSTFGKFGKMRRVLATGNVVITQIGRSATAGLVEVLPFDDKIVLTGNPVVTDTAGTVKGSLIIFYRGKQEFEVHDPEVIGEAMKNLGFPRDLENAPAAEAATPAATKPTP